GQREQRQCKRSEEAHATTRPRSWARTNGSTGESEVMRWEPMCLVRRYGSTRPRYWRRRLRYARTGAPAVERPRTWLVSLSKERQVPRQRRVPLLRRQHADQEHVEAPLEERAHAGLVAGRVEEVRDHDRQARLPRARGVVGQRLVEARAAGGADRGEKIDQAGDLGAPPRGRPALRDPLAQHAHADPPPGDEPDPAPRGRGSPP